MAVKYNPRLFSQVTIQKLNEVREAVNKTVDTSDMESITQEGIDTMIST
jgi:hypothetical protein